MLYLDKEEREKFDDELAYLNLDFENMGALEDPFEGYDFSEESIKTDIIDIFADPDNFWLTVSTILNVDLLPNQQVVLKELYTRAQPMLIASRGYSKSFLMSILIILKCVFNPGIKIVVIGVGQRQSKNLFEYIKTIWDNAPLLQQMANKDDGPKPGKDRYVFRFCRSRASFLPLGANATGIRGERANLIIVDEYGDVPKMIIDTVVIPFASVQEDPVNRAKMEARIDRYKRLGKWTKEMEEATRGMFSVNQVIVAGTAKIYFNHFAQEYEKRKKIIQSRGDKKKLAKVVDKKSLETLNPAHYSIMRIPYDLVPKGFLSRETIDSMRESLNRDTFHQEFGAIFTKDTNGFYRAALIYQMCTANDSIVYNGKLITEPFDARVKGDPEKRYVMAIDPAKKRDLAAIVILELGETHNKVVYCWTSNEEDFLELKKKYGNDNLGSYYQFIAAKILELTKRFNIEVISCDYQGGGDEIMGILQHDKAVLGDDIPLYPICDGHPLWDGKERDTDDLPGRHIIEPVQPSNATYTSISHHALLADMEKLRLIYPTYDAVSESIFALEKDEDMDGDSIKKALLEIQEMKYELTIIEYTQSDNGRERWDTPEIKSEENKKGRMVNDRMSALVMANYAARRMMDKLPELEYNPSFTYVGQKKKNVEQDWISIPQWASKQKDNVGVIRILGNKE